MPEPVVELIAQNIQATVNAITSAAGFQQDLTCARPTRKAMVDLAVADHAPVNGTVLLVQMADEVDDEHSNAGSPARLAWRQRFALLAFVSDSDAATAPIDTLINRVKSDIRRKLMEDPQRGGLALDTQQAGAAVFPDEGVDIYFDVIFRTREDDPYVNAG